MKFTYLKGWNRGKDALLAAIASAGTQQRVLPFIGVSPVSFPESDARTKDALRAAKHQPKGAKRAAKRTLIWAQYNWSRRYFSRNSHAVAVCWNGITGSRKAFMDGAKDAGAQTLYLERAPFPGRITLDPIGVNYGGSLSRDPLFYTNWMQRNAGPADAWRAIGETLTPRESRRADVGQGPATPLQGRYLFCPLQVPNDSQVRLFRGWLNDLSHMVEVLGKASKNLPEGWHIRCKEHPSAKRSLAPELDRAVAESGGKLVVDNQTDTFAQVAASEGVVTLNSSVGLQAFFYDKPVLVLGQAIFAIKGLADVAPSEDALLAHLAAPETLSFDADLRDAFMSYLDQVYYPVATSQADGTVRIDPRVVHEKLAGKS